MNRTALAVLMSAALLSLAADVGTSPWHNQFVYGRDIMTKEERIEYRAQMDARKTYDAKLAYWRQHVAWMQERVWTRGLDIGKAAEVIPAEGRDGRNRRPIFATYLMTGEEIEAYRAHERTIRSKHEYDAMLVEHEEAMSKRAWERGLPIHPTVAEAKELRRIEDEKWRGR